MNNEIRKQKLKIPPGKIRLIIDTDAKNEVDDQFAIAWALRSPERFEVEAVYAAPFFHECHKNFEASKEDVQQTSSVLGSAKDPADGMRQSYDEIKKIYELMNIDCQGRVFYGSERYIGEDGNPVISEAAHDLVRRARESKETLYVAALGAVTNIASAILIAPEIVENLVVIWLGGQPLEFGHGLEFNMMQDLKASQILLDCGVPLVVIPCMNVASMLSVSESELRENLKGKNEISDYLYRTVAEQFKDIESEKSFMKVDRGGYLRGREDYDEEYLSQFETSHISWSRIIWDISVIAFLKNPNWILSKYVPAPILNQDLTYGQAEDRHVIKVATYCWRNFVFGDLFYCLTEKNI